MDKIRKVLNFTVKQVGDPADRVLRFIGSTEDIDRAEDVIRVAGWMLENYINNPVFLWCHDYGCPPVGKAIGVVKNEMAKTLEFDIKFPTVNELTTEGNAPSEWAKFVDTVYNLYRGGYMAAVSVGFMPMKSKTRDDEVSLEKPEWMRGREYLEQELLELSAVPVPCNPNALNTAKSAGMDVSAAEKYFGDATNLYVASQHAEQVLKSIMKGKHRFLVAPDFKTASLIDVSTGESVGGIIFSDETKAKMEESVFAGPLPAGAEKAGAVLSTKNRRALAQAQELIQGVLDSAASTEEDDGKSAGVLTIKLQAADLPERYKNLGIDEIIADVLASVKDYPAPEASRDDIDLANIVADDADGEVHVDLDAIDATPIDNGGDEIEVEPEQLQEIIAEAVNGVLAKAQGRLSQ